MTARRIAKRPDQLQIESTVVSKRSIFYVFITPGSKDNRTSFSMDSSQARMPMERSGLPDIP